MARIGLDNRIIRYLKCLSYIRLPVANNPG